MAVNRRTTWADATAVQVNNFATWIKGLEVYVQPDSVNEVYVQLFNLSGVIPGTNAPNVVLAFPPATQDNRKKRKYVFPGGLYFNTALEWFVSTTPAASTAPSGNNLPEVSLLYWEPADN